MTSLRLVLPRFAYRAEMDGVVELEQCPVYAGRVAAGAQPQPAEDEVEDAEWVGWADFSADVLAGARDGVDVVPRAGAPARGPGLRPQPLARGGRRAAASRRAGLT